MTSMRKATLILAVGLLSGSAWAETAVPPLTDDAWINANSPSSNFGTVESIFVHNWGPKYGLIRFDAAAIAGQTVNSATLTLYLNDIAAAGSISLRAITSSWSESTVTWNDQPPTEAIATAIRALTLADEGSAITIDVTSAVQRWADGSVPDAGFMIVTSDGIKAFFDSKERAGGVPATLSVETDGGSSPPPGDGQAIVLDLGDPDDCTIAEPGYYVLDRSWLLTPDGAKMPNANCTSSIHISADGPVILDLGGFAILGGAFWANYEPVLWIDTESEVTLRNGGLQGTFVAIETSVSSSSRITLDGIRAGGGVMLGDHSALVIGGRFSSQFESSLQVGAASRVERAEFDCSETNCLSAHGTSVIADCIFEATPSGAPAISVFGDNTIVEGNIFDTWIYIDGNENVVARNTSQNGSIEVIGTGNLIEGNIGPDIAFEDLGNFYGNNRAKLPGGFSGTEGNVDWGGNVTF